MTARQDQAVPHLCLLPAAEAAERRRFLEYGGGSNWLTNSSDTDAVALLARPERQQVIDALAPVLSRHLFRTVPAADFDAHRRRAADHADDGGAGDQSGDGFPVPAARAATPRPRINPANDIEANVVLVAPTASGLQRPARSRPAARRTACRCCPTTSFPSISRRMRPSLRQLGRSAERQAAGRALSLSVLAPEHGGDVADRAAGVDQGRRCRWTPVGGASALHHLYSIPNGLIVNVAADTWNHGLSGRERQPDPVLRRQDLPFAAGGLHRHGGRHDHVLYPAALDLRPERVQPGRRRRPVRHIPATNGATTSVSGISSNMTASDTVQGFRPVPQVGAMYTGFTIATAHA